MTGNAFEKLVAVGVGREVAEEHRAGGRGDDELVCDLLVGGVVVVLVVGGGGVGGGGWFGGGSFKTLIVFNLEWGPKWWQITPNEKGSFVLCNMSENTVNIEQLRTTLSM